MYANNPKTLEDLKENIRTEIRRIDTAELHRVYDNMLHRAQKRVRRTRRSFSASSLTSKYSEFVFV